MKKIIFGSLFLGALGMTIFGCKKESVTTTNDANTVVSLKSKPVIYYATWDEWGRASQSCGSWGLCNFNDCWFCDNGEPASPGGWITVNPTTGDGILVIELDPAESEEQAAINDRKTLFVDANIVNNIATIFQGNYLFNPSIGSHGGYEVNVRVN